MPREGGDNEAGGAHHGGAINRTGGDKTHQQRKTRSNKHKYSNSGTLECKAAENETGKTRNSRP